MLATLQALRATVVDAARRYVSDPTTASLDHLTLSVRAMERLETRVEELERQLAAEATHDR